MVARGGGGRGGEGVGGVIPYSYYRIIISDFHSYFHSLFLSCLVLVVWDFLGIFPFNIGYIICFQA